MLYFDYLNPGSRIDLPEVAEYLNIQSSEFEIFKVLNLRFLQVILEVWAYAFNSKVCPICKIMP